MPRSHEVSIKCEKDPPATEAVKKSLDQSITQVTEIRRLGRGQSIDRSVWIYAQHFPQTVSERLGIRSIRILADGDIEFAIRTEMDGSTIMICCAAEIIEIQDRNFTACDRNVPICGEATHAVVPRGRCSRVVNIDEVVGLKATVKGNTQQSTLTGRVRC